MAHNWATAFASSLDRQLDNLETRLRDMKENGKTRQDVVTDIQEGVPMGGTRAAMLEVVIRVFGVVQP